MPSEKSLSELTQNAVTIGEKAGVVIKDFYAAHNSEVNQKADGSAVTPADMASHEILVAELSKIGPYPVVSEESFKPSQRPSGPYWLVDPLDGTKEYIKRNGQFCTNIALIQEQKPVIGIIHEPLTHNSYFAYQGGGAFKKNKQTEPIYCKQVDLSYPHCLVPNSFKSHQKERLQKDLPKIRFSSMGSALKFNKISEGQGDFYIRFRPCSEWDTAAGHCLIEEAGGSLLSLKIPVDYHKTDPIQPCFLATGFLDEKDKELLLELFHRWEQDFQKKL